MQAVILSAGSSTRTYPLTVTRPKALLKVMNITLLEHNLMQLSGIVDEVVVVVGFKKEMIMDAFTSRYKKIKITYAEQDEQLGTGHALLMAEKHLKGRFIVLNGDDIMSGKDMRRLLRNRYGVLAQKVDDPSRFGVFITEGNKLKKIIEKPAEFVSDMANVGCFALDTGIFPVLKGLEKSARGEYELTDAVSALALKSDVIVEQVHDFWFPIGYPWHLLDASSHFLRSIKRDIKGSVEENVTIKGPVVIGKGTVIRPNTYIEGPVVIGKDCIIGPHAYIRPDTTIGDRCKLRAEVFDAIIGDDCVAKHYSYIAHSVLGEDVNVGAGTITADYRHDGKNHITIVKDEKIDTYRRKLGSFMGDHVRTGINTSIYPGRKIWPWTGTLPGEVVTKDKMDMSLREHFV